MKSLLKPLLVGLLCLSLFANTASMAAQEPEPAQQAVAEKADVPPEAAAQGAALKAYFILRQHFQLDDLGKVVRYPDNYGGTYINEDNELVLCITVWDTWVDEAVKQVEQVKGPMKVQFCSASINAVSAGFTPYGMTSISSSSLFY